MSGEIKEFLEMCDICRAFHRKQPKETLIYRGWNYLICVVYYSSFCKIDPLDNTTLGSVKEVKVAVWKAWNPGDMCIRQWFSGHLN